MSNGPGGIEYAEAWLVTEGWGEQPVMIFPTEESAKAYISMQKINQGRAVRLDEQLEKIKKKHKKDIITQLDRDWTEARNRLIWEV